MDASKGHTGIEASRFGLAKQFKVIGENWPANTFIQVTIPVFIHVDQGQVLGIYPAEEGQFRLNHQDGHVYINIDPDPELPADAAPVEDGSSEVAQPLNLDFLNPDPEGP